MSDAEHLIENAIYALKRGKFPEEVLSQPPNTDMLASTGISMQDVSMMAQHVVYVLYNGQFPE